MTNLDQYQLCVCGSGKKLKFCKCGAVDHAAELEKIIRLMEADQGLAAMERINSQLVKIPNASWLLALKTGLALLMNELPSFIDATNRFLKLKPDNPLALAFRSILAAIQNEPIEVEARSLLDSMAESRDSITEHTLHAIRILADRICHSDCVGLLGIWGELQDSTAENPGKSVTRDPSIHLACKSSNRLIEGPTSAPWFERLQEVIALCSAYRYEQAEKKLVSILRDYPGEPEPLSHLLRAQVAQLDRSGAIATARKLAEHGQLSLADRAYFQVLAWEYDQAALNCASIVHYGQIESDESLIETLSANADLLPIDDDQMRAYMGALVGDEVLAKRAYEIFLPTKSETENVKAFAGTIAVYGKQTDKPARALLMAIDYGPNRPTIERLAEQLSISQPIESKPDQPISFIEFLQRSRIVNDSPNSWLPLPELGRQVVEEFLNLPQKELEGKSPLEAIGEERLRVKLQALLLHFEGSQSLLVLPEAIAELYQRLQIDQPPLKSIGPDDQKFGMESYLDLLHLDLSKLTDPLLISVTQIAMAKGATRLSYVLAQELLRRNDTGAPEGLIVAHSILVETIPNLNEKLTHIEKIIELNASTKRPVGRYVLFKTRLLNSLGQMQAAEDYMLSSLRKYPDDPELLAFMQQASLVNQRMAMSDGMGISSATARQAPAESTSSLVLPGQPAPAGSSESKLWLPGS